MEPVSGNRRERRAHQAAPPKPKGSRRTIALSPSLAEELPTRYRPALVFAGIDGDPIQPGSVTRMFARIVGRTKIRPISFHGLRHSNATDLLRGGVHPKIASERLGHASVAITMDILSRDSGLAGGRRPTY